MKSLCFHRASAQPVWRDSGNEWNAMIGDMSISFPLNSLSSGNDFAIRLPSKTNEPRKQANVSLQLWRDHRSQVEPPQGEPNCIS